MNLPPRSRASRLLAKLLLSEGLSSVAAEQLEGRQMLDGLAAFNGFTPPIPNAPTDVRYTVASDFNRDGKDELIAFSNTMLTVVNLFQSTRFDTDTARSRPFASPGVKPIVLDANGDGRDDLLIGKWLALNDGTGAFPSPWSSVGPDLPGSWVTDTVALDFDSDGDSDVVMRYSNQTLVFLQNDGAGNLSEVATQSHEAGVVATPHIVEKFSGKTGQQVLVEQIRAGQRSLWSYELEEGTIVRRNLEVPHQALVTFVEQQSLRFFDADRDGMMDILRLVPRSDFQWGLFPFDTNILRGRSDGTFGAEETYLRIRILVAANDIDLDGTQDIVVYGGPEGYSTFPNIFSHRVILGERDARSQIVSSNAVSEPDLFADVDGDGDRDLLDIVTGTSFQIRVMRTSTLGVTEVAWTQPMAEVFAYEGVPGTGGLTGWEMYADTDNSGSWTHEDVPPDLGDRYDGNSRRPGNYRLFMVRRTNPNVPYEASPIEIREVRFRSWTSLYMPEGWRDPHNVNEFLPLLNTNSLPVEYRVVVRYAAGERDQEVARGILPATSRGGVTLAERGQPSPIRPNEAYSIEVQSTAYISAAFTHYDNFGNPGRGQAAGENLVGTGQTYADFGLVNSDDMVFLTFYTPYPTRITIRYTDEMNQARTHLIRTEESRRSGAYFRNLPGVEPGKRYSVTTYCTHEQYSINAMMFATMTTYTPDSATLVWGTGYFNTPEGVVLPVRDGLVHTLNVSAFYTPSWQTTTTQLQLVSPDGVTRTITETIQGRTTRQLNLSNYANPSESHITIRPPLSSNQHFPIVSFDNVRRDATATGVKPSRNYHTFAEGYLEPGNSRFEATLALFNPSTSAAVTSTLRFFTTDGRIVTTTVNVPANNGALVNLSNIPALVSLPGLRWFATEVISSGDVTAEFTHWDRNQPGGVSF